MLALACLGTMDSSAVVGDPASAIRWVLATVGVFCAVAVGRLAELDGRDARRWFGVMALVNVGVAVFEPWASLFVSVGGLLLAWGAMAGLNMARGVWRRWAASRVGNPCGPRPMDAAPAFLWRRFGRSRRHF